MAWGLSLRDSVDASPVGLGYTRKKTMERDERKGPVGGKGKPAHDRAVSGDEGGAGPETPVDDSGTSRARSSGMDEFLGAAKEKARVLSGSARRFVDQGRYRKLRISRKGKQVLPDIPLAAVVAAEAASMYGAGVARVIAANLGAKFLFDVQIVNDADQFLREGEAQLLEGDLEAAERALLRAYEIDDRHAKVCFQLGVLHRLQGDYGAARRMLERARRYDGPAGEVRDKAVRILEALDRGDEG